MQPDDIHFAVVWPTAHDGPARKVIVPFQCSLAEASTTVGCFAASHRKLPCGVGEIETSVLGSFCMFSSPTSVPPALIVVGTKSWSCASSVFAFIRCVQADLARDQADFGYWQLRSLALRTEAVVPSPGDESSNVLPRLLEEYNWDDEQSESWEDDDMWLGTADAAEISNAKAEMDGLRSEATTDASQLQRIADLQVEAFVPSEDQNSSRVPAAPLLEQAYPQVPLIQVDLDDEPSTRRQQQQKQQQLRQHASPTVFDSGLAVVDQMASSVTDTGGENSSLIHSQHAPTPAAAITQTPGAPSCSSALSLDLDVRAELSPLLGVLSPSSEKDESSELPSQAEDLSMHVAPAKGRFNAAAATGAETPAGVDAPVAISGDAGEAAAAAITANAEGNTDVSQAAAAGTTVAVSAAVSEDLAYVHQGSVLKSFAITGSVLVAASHGARARLRITDKHGHIANATAISVVAAENTAGSISPTREYVCKAGPVQQAGAPPKFLRAVAYRCSPAVKILPVRVTCRLNSAGNSLLVWAQVIANPQLPQPLCGVSVLVSLPFSPRNEGHVQSEPPATLKPDRKMLEWVLPMKMKPGGKQVMQARLIIDEGQMAGAAIQQTAPAMVKCHLLDSTFSSVELEIAAMAEERGQVDAGRVMKRCRVQCTQQVTAENRPAADSGPSPLPYPPTQLRSFLASMRTYSNAHVPNERYFPFMPAATLKRESATTTAELKYGSGSAI